MKLTRTPHIEVVLPIYNEVNNLVPLIELLDRAADELANAATVTYLFINDGSNDGSKQLLERLHKDRADIRIVNFIHNFGHSAALSAGIEYFDADIAVFMDADLQDSPKVLTQMFEAWKRGSKTVVAERGSRQEKNSYLFKTFYFLLHRTAKKLPPINFGTYCLLDRSVVTRLKALPEKNRYFPGLVSFTSGEITPIRVDRQSRAHGTSRVGMWGLINLAVTAFLSFSNTPIRLVSIFGLCAAGGSILLGAYILGVKAFTERAIPGWASMMTAIAFASGVQLLCLGMIGEYIARIFEEVKQRPLFLVDRVIDRNVSGKTRKLRA